LKVEKYPSFDRNRDKLIRNFYCSGCLAGPFNEEDVKKNLLMELGGDRQVIHYCRMCYSTKMQFKNPQIFNFSEEDKQREEYITSGKALAEMRERLSNIAHYNKPEEIKQTADKKPAVIKKEKVVETTQEEEALIEEIIEDIPEIQEIPEPVDEVIVEPTPQPELKPEPKPANKKESFDITTMKAKDIINFVKERTGQDINISLKSKSLIIKRAMKLLDGFLIAIEVRKKVNPAPEANTFESMSASQIIKLVKEKTGQEITISTKSKKRIVALASTLLSNVK